VTFSIIVDVVLVLFAFINVCMAFYSRVIKEDTPEATYYFAAAAVMLISANL
jgi:biopolymer transport protein ExbD